LNITIQRLLCLLERNLLCSKIKGKEEIDRFKCYQIFQQWLLNVYHSNRAEYYQIFNSFSQLTYFLANTIHSEQIIANKNNNTQLDFVINALSSFSSYEYNLAEKNYIDSVILSFQMQLRGIFAFNCAIELFSKFLNIPELQDVFTLHTNTIDQNLVIFYREKKQLKSILTGTKEERIKKRSLTNIIFPNFNMEKLKPNKDSIREATNALSTLFKQHKPSSVIDILMGK